MNHSLLHTERRLIAIFLGGAFLFLVIFEGFFLLSRYFFEEKISRSGFSSEIQRIENRPSDGIRRGREAGPRIGLNIFTIDQSGSIQVERGPGLFEGDESIISKESLSKIATGVIIKTDGILIYKRTHPENSDTFQIFIRKSGYPLEDLLRDILRFLILDILIIAPFYFMGRYFVRRTLDPVSKNIETMSHFIHDAGHELKTPLAIVSGNLQILRESKHFESDLVEESIKTISSMTNSLDGLIELSKVENVKEREKIYLRESLQGELEKEKQNIDEKGLRITLEVPEDATISMNSKHFSLFFGNLIRNAVLYNKPKGEIRIKFHEDTLEISDTGIGIDEKNISKIWERFFREDRTGKNPGTGIGLSLVKTICELYNWKISLKSKKNVGTTFILKIK